MIYAGRFEVVLFSMRWLPMVFQNLVFGWISFEFLNEFFVGFFQQGQHTGQHTGT